MNHPPTTPTKQSYHDSGFDLAEFGFTTPQQMSQKMVLGFSNQRNRRTMEREESERQRGRLLKRQSLVISVPTLSSPSSTASSAVSTPSITTPTAQSSQTFGVPTKKLAKKCAEKKSFFNLKNASTPILNSFSRSSSPAPSLFPTSPSPAPKSFKGTIGLGILMGNTPSSAKNQKRTSSKMFKVGQGNSAIYFEPVQPGRRPSTFEQHLAQPLEVMDSEDEDSSDEEFVSFRRSYESLAHESRVVQPVGPSTLAELMQLRSTTQDLYVQARRESQAGPSRIEATPVVAAPKRLHRKAVPVLRSVRKAVPPLFLEPITPFSVEVQAPSSTPSIPERVGSLPPTPVLLSTPVLSAESFPPPPSGHLRHQSEESSSSSSSLPSLADRASGRTSISSSISTLRSAGSETDSMPVTPQVAQYQMQSTLFPGHDKTYELDVASGFVGNSSRNNAVVLGSEADDDEEEDVLAHGPKAFYQNQMATKSTWAVITAKLKPKPATQDKTGLRRFFNRARA